MADAEPRLPDLTPTGMGAGLLMVAEPAASFGGTVGVEAGKGCRLPSGRPPEPQDWPR
ncbi:hypothetical protein OHB54_38400 [Streptomyces sp. NBC_01007]|nr:hypothetical protein OHB54_38400 [Streptomyces sp. NBC_01007]